MRLLVSLLCLKSTDGGKTWKEKKDGLDIPIARSVFSPPGTGWIFAGPPTSLFISKDGGESRRSGELVLQFIKNMRRDVGGAAFIDAYWRGRYYGCISDAVAGQGESPCGIGRLSAC